MKAETLRKSILQWAVEGKLVPQLDCELAVEQIGEAPEDVPFLIPEKWKWVQLKKLVVPTKQKIPNSEFNYLDVSSVNSSTREIRAPKRISPESSPSRARKIVKQGMVLFSTVRPYLLNTVVIDSIEPGIETIASTAFATFSCNENLNNRYVWFLFQSPYFIEYVKSKQKGAAYPAISDKDFYSVPIPLPPIQEQRLIVQKLNELLPLVESYGKEQEALEKLEKELPGKLRASLLNEAIQGKLVPQLDTEPAAEQIGEVPEDIPFSIPEKWKWVQLKAIGTIVGGGTPKTNIESYWSNGTINWFTPADLGEIQGDYAIESTRKITPDGLKESSAKLMPPGSILFSSRAPIGYIAISTTKCCTNQGCKSFVPNLDIISTEWAYYAILALTDEIKSRASGTTFKEISGKEMGKTWVPLPPLEEQRRIVEKLNALFKDLDRLTR